MAKRKAQTAPGENTQLSARLAGYTVTARGSAAANRRAKRFGNWPIYAAATGSALAMATGASASIIYFGQSDNYTNTVIPNLPYPQILATQFNAQFIGPLELAAPGQLDNASHLVDLRATASATFGLVRLEGVGRVHIFVTNGTVAAKKFASGASISAGAGSAKASAEIVRSSGLLGNFGSFLAGQKGFAGLSVSDIGGNPLLKDYGWIRLEVLNGATNDFPDELEAIDWAFEQTPGVAIRAGEQVEPTPEPGTMALALLACGAAAVAALRRRRHAPAKPTWSPISDKN